MVKPTVLTRMLKVRFLQPKGMKESNLQPTGKNLRFYPFSLLFFQKKSSDTTLFTLRVHKVVSLLFSRKKKGKKPGRHRHAMSFSHVPDGTYEKVIWLTMRARGPLSTYDGPTYPPRGGWGTTWVDGALPSSAR